MKMDSTTRWTIGIFAFIAVIVAVLFSSGIIQQSALGGYQVLSLSKASVVQDGTLGQSWLVTVSTIPSSFAITGKIQSSDVASQSGSAPLTDFDVYMSVAQQLKYPISDSGDQLFDYYIVPSNSFVCIAPFCGGTPNCPDNAGNSAFSGIRAFVGSASDKDYCVYRTQHGKVGILQANQVTAGGKSSDPVTLNTDLQTTGSTDLTVNGKVLGRVYYAGDLVNSAQYRPELFQSYKPINKDGRWYFTSYSAFNQYNSLNAGGISAVKNAVDSCLLNKVGTGGFTGSPDAYMAQCVANYHDAFDSMSEVSVSGLKEITSSGNGIYATFTADKLYSFPVLTFILDTDWVGIKVLSGTPKINSLTVSQDCTSGTHGKVSAVVSNTGGSLGAFDVSMTCPDTDVLTSVLTDNWLPAQQKTLSFEYDMNAIVSRTTKTCTVTAKDKGSSVFDQKTVSVSCNPTQVCTPNQGFCDGQTRKICNAEGSGFATALGDNSCIVQNKCSVDTDCGATMKCQNGACVDLGQTCTNQLGGLIIGSYGTVQSCSFWCQIGLAKPAPVNTCVYDDTPLIIVIVAVIIILAIILFTQKPKKGKKGMPVADDGKVWYEKKSNIVALAVGLGVIIIIFYFKYVFWLTILAVILAVLLFIFRKKVVKPIKAMLG
jgi:hypothetical protein